MNSWRKRLAVAFGPGLFPGVTYTDWCHMLRENRFAVHPKYCFRASVITQYSFLNSIAAQREQRRFGLDIEKQIIFPPVFILGHWRSGTTHLHNLLSQDDRFAFPSLFETLYPHSFLSEEDGAYYKLLHSVMPRTRPMDNMYLDLSVPWEDEYATCAVSGMSPYMSAVFPNRLAHYDRYMTFRHASDREVTRWKSSLIMFLKKLTYKYRRPLILKSPPHTCRIRLLLKEFPDAKFVHVHRNPIDVFQSTQHQTRVMLRWYELQRFPRIEIDDWIIRRYREMYDAFFSERPLIPSGHFHEIAFEELETDPVGTMRTAYSALDLPEFDHVKSKLSDYVKSLDGYRKNVFAEMSAELSDRLAHAWRACFEEWGYPVRAPLDARH